MIDFDFDRLQALGLTPALASQAVTLAMTMPSEPALHLMRLTGLHRETVQVHDGADERSMRVLPRLQRLLAEDEDVLAVGDWVLVAPDAFGQVWVHGRVASQTRLVRRDADGRRHAVVANVDTALLVMGLDDDFNPRRMERFLALVQGSGVQPVVVLSKADGVLDARSLFVRVQAVRSRVASDVEVLSVDARDAETAQRLAPFTRAGQTLVLLGSSGAGKSTLTNTLLGQAVQDTGAVREHDSRGKHTTTARSLHRLPCGGCVIDTPGLRALRPDADERAVAATFGDVEALALQCRFRDCRHQDEPGCAVREGVAGDRLRNYHKLLREARRDTMSALERQRQVALWKARGREGRTRLKAKRGEE